MSRSAVRLSTESSLCSPCANRTRVCIQLRKALRSLFGGERSLWRLFATSPTVCKQSHESLRGPFASTRRVAVAKRGSFRSPSNPTNAVQLSQRRCVRFASCQVLLREETRIRTPAVRSLWGSVSISKLHSVASCFGRRQDPTPFSGFRLVSVAASIVSCSVELCASCCHRPRRGRKFRFGR